MLPDLVVDGSPVNEAQRPIHLTSVTPTNNFPGNEFDFPALSSEDENTVNVKRNSVRLPADTQDKESKLTEEEGDAVNALLSPTQQW